MGGSASSRRAAASGSRWKTASRTRTACRTSTCRRCAWSSPSAKRRHGSRFQSVTYFSSLEAMESLVQMGMMEGMRSAMRQIDAVLQDLRVVRRHARHRGAAPRRHHGAHRTRDPRHGGAGLARASRSRADAALAPRPRRLDDAGVRGRDEGGRTLSLRVGIGRRLAALRLRGRAARVGAAVPRRHHRADDRHGRAPGRATS